MADRRIPSWLRDTVRVWTQYLAIGAASVLAVLCYALLLNVGLNQRAAIVITLCLGAALAFFTWRYLDRRLFTPRTEPYKSEGASFARKIGRAFNMLFVPDFIKDLFTEDLACAYEFRVEDLEAAVAEAAAGAEATTTKAAADLNIAVSGFRFAGGIPLVVVVVCGMPGQHHAPRVSVTHGESVSAPAYEVVTPTI